MSESHQSRMLTFVGILLAMFLGALDQTIVATALPRIVRDLQGLDRYAWVATSYLLTSTVLVPVFGKLADIVSRKLIVLWSIVIFLAGSVLCGLSGEFGTLPILGDGMSQLIIFRGFQGIGSSGIFAMAFIVISDLFPPAERGRYQGFIGSVFGLSSVLGPLAGGLLTDYGSSFIEGIAGWRWVFYVNVPFAVIALWFIIARMPPLHPKAQGERFSFLSALLLIVGTVPLILALELDKTLYPWGGAVTLSLFAASVVALVLFVLHSRYDKNPILDLGLFKYRVFTIANLATFFFGAAFLSIVIFLPLFMVNVLGVSATNAGLTIIPLSIGLVIGSVGSGQLVSRIGKYKVIMIVGGAILVLGAFLLSRLSVHTTFLEAALFMFVCGIGIGPSMPLYVLAIQNVIEVRKIGQATSASQFFRQIGSTVGAAIMGTVLATSMTAAFAKNMPGDLASGHSDATQAVQSHLMAGGGDLTPAQLIQKELDTEYALIVKLFKDNDQAALAQLEASPYLPAQYKQQLLAGGPAQQVAKQFEAKYTTIAAAARSEDVTALRQALAASKLPPQAAAALIGVVRSGNQRAIEGFLTQLHAQLLAQTETVGATATDAALAAIKQEFDRRANTLGSEVAAAIKTSFAESISRVYFWTIFIALVGFIITFFVPEYPLRKSFDHAGPGSPHREPVAPTP